MDYSDIIAIGYALYALESLLYGTSSIYVTVIISVLKGDLNNELMEYIELEISDEDVKISSRGSIYDAAIRGDSYSNED